ncbi:phospho-2-dehydro-3-deoxyheptonate aldolase [Microlunatus endophyticus]|uniref:Phospho-2-dehydro-3-deoxyheptonate aldolase n=1 Tax=Microlunatus endophyticus TaxID=1716077 RepID=A0A917S383_9ACTN|nr:3-deoxy-7-phosphoheptulonate synthase [Microlunatus endophyticus]GGL53707.1 phospho-2-dehydro-3-deoxyheptonate aldolase [Microlunatus endophyticus]
MSTTLQDQSRISDTHVAGFQSLATPDDVRRRLPVPPRVEAVVRRGREEIAAVLSGADDRLLVITGPCSVHDTSAALDYAQRLRPLAEAYADDLVVVMRSYFEKPRTTVGWKGLINDPHLDGSHDIEAGLEIARRFLIEIATIGLPTATELLEPITPQYIAELISWAAIGARTTESQIHRQLASGLSMPVGFKNGTDGDVQVAVDGAVAARNPQSFLGIDGDGRAALATTTGNPDSHIVLRGGRSGPNYSTDHVAAAIQQVSRSGLEPYVIIDASHANSGKDHRRQAEVVAQIAGQIAAGERGIGGVMMESFLVGGAQPLEVPVRHPLVYGQSVTDACLSWEATAQLLGDLAAASRARRLV